MHTNQIENIFVPKAMCLIFKKDSVLLYKSQQKNGAEFYRPPGGHIEYGETSFAAVKREIKEELGSELSHVQLLAVLENIFIYNEIPCHEYDFIYIGTLVDKTLYEREEIIVTEEPNDRIQKLHWEPLKRLKRHADQIVPTGILPIIEDVIKATTS